jgi:indolepyruvate ferredoxin oxidoreductase alpha subunit
MQAVKEAVEFEGVSVIISQELCPLFARRVAPSKKKPFQVRQDKCKMHLDCITKVACPAMFKEDGQVRINANVHRLRPLRAGLSGERHPSGQG